MHQVKWILKIIPILFKIFDKAERVRRLRVARGPRPVSRHACHKLDQVPF